MKNEYKITKKVMMSWAKEYHLQGAASIISFCLLCLVGLMGFIMLILCIFFEADWLDWYFSILFLLFSIYKLFFARFAFWSNKYKMLSKTYGVPEWTRTTEFTDEEIILSDHTSTAKIRYSNIKKIKEKNNIVMIFLNDNQGLRLYKDAFVEGSWEECKEKINSILK